jgi:predicted DNA-binding protein (UPF0251 family)
VQCNPNAVYFKPRAVPLPDLEELVLAFDELEAQRLADLEGCYQIEAAACMRISRQTFGNIIKSARRKVADALVNSKAIRIEGGVCSAPKGEMAICGDCSHTWKSAPSGAAGGVCPNCTGSNVRRLPKPAHGRH